VLAVRNKVELVGDDELARAMPSRQGIVELGLRDGRRLRHHAKAVRGTAENPMPRAEVEAKAYDLAAPVLGERRARRLCETILNVEGIGDVRELRPLLKEKR
jgi:2-methylcitrate dehydratase PrpD